MMYGSCSPDETQMKTIDLKMFMSQCFGKDVGYLVLNLAKNHFNESFLYLLTQKVMPNINMLGMLMVHRVFGYIHYACVVALDGNVVDFNSKVL